MKYGPKGDGISHINIYSKGKTQLGRYLSNWHQSNLSISIGHFLTLEGLIFFLGSFDDRLRETEGYDSKMLGEEVDRKIRLPEDVFKKYIIEAMNEKVRANSHLRTLLTESTLPLTHYYCYNEKVIQIPKWQWQVTEWEKIRKELQEIIND